MRLGLAILVALTALALSAGPASAQSPCIPPIPLPGCDDDGPDPPDEPPGQGPPDQPPAPPPPEPPPSDPPCAVRTPKHKGTFVGLVSEQVFAGGDRYRRCALTQQADAGVQVLRQTFRWSEIERSRGQYSWGYYDRYVRAVASHGIRIMAILYEPPPFRSGRPAGNTERGVYPPKRYADMGRFAARVVKRYGSKGRFWRANPKLRKVPIRQWQVWNEPNFPHYWLPKPNAREYTALQRVVARAIWRTDRKAEVLTAGMPHSTAPGAIPLNKYLNQMYSAGARGTFDTLAINAYARTAKELMKRIKGARKVMRKRRDKKTPIAVTEIGWATGGPNSRYTVTPGRQAKLIRASFRAVTKQRRKLRLKGLVYYNWQDAEPYSGFGDFWGLHTGLLDKNGNAKPGLAAFGGGAAAVARGR